MKKPLNNNNRLLALLFALLVGAMAHAQSTRSAHEFTVSSDGTKVIFSPGNLQYIGSASTPYWKFADHQWDYLGTTTGQNSSSSAKDRDLFGWGTSGYNHGAVAYQPWATNQTNSDYYAYGSATKHLYSQTPMTADWGYNAISNGGNTENSGWRTPTKEEWTYVFNTRSTTSGIRYAKAKVNNANGVILLPDDWSTSYYSLSNTNQSGASFSSNVISATQWNTLEQHGAVFLPAAGRRYGTSVNNVGSYGYYWSASYCNSSSAYGVYFYDSGLYAANYENRYDGQSVRLVCPAGNYSFGINATPSPAEGGAVSGGGTYQGGADCTLTATPAAGYAFANWTENGTVVSTEPSYSFTVCGDRNLVANFEEAIVFADANVKALCVANWDANGDGELSYAEAAAVTNLSSAFAFSDIVSFDELQYFTGLTSLNDYEFGYCTSLTSISIPCIMQSIGDGAFEGCGSLATITSYAVVPPTMGSGVFDGIPANATAHVPSCTTAAYQAASGWSSITHYEGFDVGELCPIEFADANVKAICVENWDTNGDGALSYAEAAAVTNLSTYFRNKTTITSFDELQYFTGLTSIGNYAFYYCSSLTSVTIPNSVTSVGSYAFYDCSGLTSVEIPNSVTSIGDSAFSGCSGLTSVEIPNSVTSISSSAFQNCSGLTSVVIGNSVTSIGQSAFSNCSSLTQIIVEEGNSVYDSRGNCNAIIETATNTLVKGCKNTVIPNSVTSIGSYAFQSCSGLTSVVIGNSVTSIGARAFYDCSGLTSVVIGNSVTSIGELAFYGCSGLTSITSYATTPPTLGTNVFQNVPTTATVYVPCATAEAYQTAWSYFSNFEELVTGDYCPIDFADDNVKAICIAHWDTDGDGELSYAEAATVTDLGAYFKSNSTITSFDELQYFTGLTTVPNTAFMNCTSLASVSLPSSITSLGNGAFFNCSSLVTITSYAVVPPTMGSNVFDRIPDNATVFVPSCSSMAAYQAASGWSGITHYEGFDGGELCPIEFADANVKALCVANWDTNGDGELSYAEAAAVTDLGQVFRNNSTITSFDELQYFTGLTSIGSDAFSDCSGLTSVEIPNSVTSIGSDAFSYCYYLTSVEIPNSVTSIGSYAFYDCSGLTSVEIPNSVTSIGVYAFYGCRGLTSVEIPNSVTSIGDRAFFVCSGLTQIIVEEGNSVYDSRDNCNAIIETATNTLVQGCKNTVIPNSVTSIGSSAFWGCSGLTSVEIPNSVTSIGSAAFLGCSGLTSVEIPNSVTSIGNVAFSGCSGLTAVEIPKSVTSIGGAAFSDCSGLTSVTIGNPVTRIGSVAFSGCSGLTSVTIGNSVTSIGDYAFNYCSGLTSVTIPNSVTSIGSYAFYNCSGLTSVEIPNSVTSIGSSAFSYCSGLTSVTIGNSVTSIGYEAFFRCSGLTSLEIPNSVTSIERYAFNGCSGLTSITSYATTPPTLGSNAFGNVPTTATVYVPCESLEAYQSISWGGFSNFVCIEDESLFVSGYGDTDGNYYLIATPYGSVNPTNVAGMTDGSYDLYRFDQSEELEWRNYKAATFNLEAGKGYLYAHQTDVALRFGGTPYSGTGTFPLEYVAGKHFAGWNLVGNPYAQTLTAYTTENVANGCYVMNGTRDNLMVSEISETNPLQPYEGFFVKATGENASISFGSGERSLSQSKGRITLELTQDGLLIDRLIVKTASGDPLEKFTLNENGTRIYATQGGQDYAIVTVGGRDVSTDEIPVNFKAAKHGTYTIAVNTENVEAEYLHLIDNLTGADVDLLASSVPELVEGPNMSVTGASTGSAPSYTFEAKPTDYASRFKLVFEAGSVFGDEDGDNATFAYINANGEIVLTGVETQNLASLQIVDMLGRVIRCTDVARNVSTNGLVPGVYVLRLVSDDGVKTQKIVVR